MATNKHATIRYQALDRCFRNPGRRYFMEDLIAACNEALVDVDASSSGVKRRQVFEDIKFMEDSRGFNAPIERFKDGKKTYYRYGDLNFSINNQPLNEQEAQQLRESLLTLSRFSGLPQFTWIEEIKARLEQHFHLKTNKRVISFEENPYLQGLEHISPLYASIVNNKAIEIEYKPFKHEETLNFVIHPYYLKQYNTRWFLFGWNEVHDKLTNIALDRIITMKEANIPYKSNMVINFDDFFEDVIGVSVPENRETQKVLLKIDIGLWPYIKTKPLHGSQKIFSKDDSFYIIQLDLILNYELESLILSFGEKIEVIEPIEFRNKIIRRIRSLESKYV